MYGITGEYKILKIAKAGADCLVVAEFTPQINGEVRPEFIKRNKLYLYRLIHPNLVDEEFLLELVRKVFSPSNERFTEIKDKTPYLKYLI